MEFSKIYKYVVPTLKNGGVGVLPTDTIYGIVGAATNKRTVEKIYRLRRRNPKKPMIILIGSIVDLRLFGIAITPMIKKILKKVWPGKVSMVLPMNTSRRKNIVRLRYLHRGTKTLAFRLPREPWLRALIKRTGPLVAPSANFEGAMPARTIKEAKKYFDDKVNFYVDAGRLSSKSSTLVKIENGKLKVLRPGAAKIR